MSTSNISNTALDSRNWLDLPDEVTAKILKKLGPVEILETAQKVCPSWWRICKDSSMWRCVHVTSSGDVNNMRYMEKMCRHIVDRSDGQLIEITIERLDYDQLLPYIADQSSGLKCLRLVRCFDIKSTLINDIPKLPLLEEFELTECCCLPINLIIKAVGKSFRLLNSLKLNRRLSLSEKPCDDDALAIAENMPGLRYLQLVGNKLTDNGLRAILGGCPNLESLDLRQCYDLRFEGNLKETCVDQVKSLKFPCASSKGGNNIPHFLYCIDCPDEEEWPIPLSERDWRLMCMELGRLEI
ncbi:hypothetical protein ACFE04_031026 [Oxalis oulophora]